MGAVRFFVHFVAFVMGLVTITVGFVLHWFCFVFIVLEVERKSPPSDESSNLIGSPYIYYYPCLIHCSKTKATYKGRHLI